MSEHCWTETIWGAVLCCLGCLLLFCLCILVLSNGGNTLRVQAIPPSRYTHGDFSLSSQKHTKEQNTDLDLGACSHTSSSPSHELCYWHWSYIVIFSNWTIYVTKDSSCLERVLVWATVRQSLVLISLLITQGGENVVNIQTSEIY